MVATTRRILHEARPLEQKVRQPHGDGGVPVGLARRKLDLKKRAELERAARQMWANLPPNYQWLKDWEYV